MGLVEILILNQKKVKPMSYMRIQYRKIQFISTAYRTKTFDRIESNSAYTRHENELIDINQEGLESEFLFNGNNQNISLIQIFQKVERTMDKPSTKTRSILWCKLFKNLIQNFMDPLI